MSTTSSYRLENNDLMRGKFRFPIISIVVCVLITFHKLQHWQMEANFLILRVSLIEIIYTGI
jgi:hypothetical protein